MDNSTAELPILFWEKKLCWTQNFLNKVLFRIVVKNYSFVEKSVSKINVIKEV